MWNIIKSLFRYSFKHKVSLITLTFLTFLSTGIFASLLMLSNNLNDSYKKLVNDGNLNNAIINELYSTQVEGQPNLKGEAAKQENKKLFLESLDTMIGSDNYRRFQSIDFNTTNSGIAFKIVESDPNYTIDKLVVYAGNNLLSPTYNFEATINAGLWNNDGMEAANARRLIIFLASRAAWTDTKALDAFKNAWATLSSIDTPTDLANIGAYDPKNNNNLDNAKTVLQRWLTPTASNYLPLTNKTYRLGFDYGDATLPIVGRIDNFSSYTVVVPSYVLSNHKKEVLPTRLYDEYVSMNHSDSQTNQSVFTDWFDTIPNTYKIQVDNLDFLIVGTGTTPDFMYPVFSFEKTIPNIKSEIIMFTNNGGYQLSYDSNRSSPTDNYLVCNIPNITQKKLNEINAMSRKYMGWPSNISSIYMYNDINNQLTPAPIRVNFLPSLVNMQIALSNALALFIGILASIVFIFTINKFIDDNKASLSILRANGIKKRTIIWATSFFGMIPSFGGGVLGYLFGQLSQTMFLSLYSYYWTIPTVLTIFNPILFFGLILTPFLVMMGLSVISSWLLLRQNTYKLMSESAKFRITPFAKLVGIIFAKTSIMNRFKVSIAFSSLPKLLAITTLFTLVSSGISFATSITNKFEETQAATLASKNYNFAIDLITPTVQGGQYFTSDFKNIGKAIVNEQNEVLNFNIGMADPPNGIIDIGSAYNKLYQEFRGQKESDLKYYLNPSTLNPNFASQVSPNSASTSITLLGDYSLNHLPSLTDSSWQKDILLYLNNRTQSPFALDVTVGALGLETNPWDIAKTLAPPNVSLNADLLTQQLWTKILNDENKYFNTNNVAQYVGKKISRPALFGKTTYFDANSYIGKSFNKIFTDFSFITFYGDTVEPPPTSSKTINLYKDETTNISKGWYQVKKDNLKAGGGALTYPTPGTVLNANFIVLIGYILNFDEYQDYIFKSLYNVMPVEKDDDTYTRVVADIIGSNSNVNQQITIKGIKPTTEYIELINLQNENVNHKIALANNLEQTHENSVHDLYTDDVMSDPANYNLVINESAAYQYKLNIGDTIVINPVEESTRFDPSNVIEESKINFDKYNNSTFALKVADIIKTYQYPEFFINQRIANHINVMDHPSVLKTSFTNDYIFDEIKQKDIGVTVQQIDPFNGLFSKSENIKAISQTSSVYSISSLAPATDKITQSEFFVNLFRKTIAAGSGDLNSVINQGKYISKIKLAESLGFVNNDGSIDIAGFEAVYKDTEADAIKLINQVIEIWGNSPLLSTIYNVEYVSMYTQVFENLTGFVSNISVMVLIILFSISILSVIFLSIEFISSAISIIAILKALGFYDRTNAFAFLSMFFPAIIFALTISIPISMLVMTTMQSFIYGFGSIYLPLTYLWWYISIPAIILFAILAITIGAAIWLLKRQDITRVIARY